MIRRVSSPTTGLAALIASLALGAAGCAGPATTPGAAKTYSDALQAADAADTAQAEASTDAIGDTSADASPPSSADVVSDLPSCEAACSEQIAAGCLKGVVAFCTGTCEFVVDIGAPCKAAIDAARTCASHAGATCAGCDGAFAAALACQAAKPISCDKPFCGMHFGADPASSGCSCDATCGSAGVSLECNGDLCTCTVAGKVLDTFASAGICDASKAAFASHCAPLAPPGPAPTSCMTNDDCGALQWCVHAKCSEPGLCFSPSGGGGCLGWQDKPVCGCDGQKHCNRTEAIELGGGVGTCK